MSKVKQKKLFENLLKVTEQYVTGKSYIPMSERELTQKLSIPPQHHELFQEVLRTHLKNKLLTLTKGRYAANSKPTGEIVSGVLRVHPRGFGFLQPDDAVQYPQDIFIPKHLTLQAVDGDNVEVLINPEATSDKGPEGKVISITTRGRTHIAGVVKQVSHSGDAIAYVPLLGTEKDVYIESATDLKVGDRVVLEVIDWGSKDSDTVCKFSRHIGHISDPSCDIPAAIEEFEIRSAFPPKAIEEAESYGTKVSLTEIKNREDLRDMVCITIDPDTAKDFDDAITLTKDSKGHYHLGVHIADVSHYVRPGTALDAEATLRCNSTYFPGVCVPMLPPALSDNLCSLKPNVNRLTASVFVQFDANGDMVNYRIARTVIKSSKRMTYKEAKSILDGKLKSQYLPNLQLMVELCGHLKRKRYERGSIEFSIPELVVMVDKDGVPYTTDYIEYDITHQLVEEFMLKANELVATHLTKQGKNLTYRIHDIPAEENMRDFAMLASAFGYNLSDKPTPSELQKMFDEAIKTPYGEYLASSYIRRMRLAIYSATNIGHYGLSLSHYCHFTSPIRRYVDLVVHRILFGESDELKALEDVSHRCSEQERVSAKAESSVVLLKKLRLLEKFHKEDSSREYEAIITKVKPFGIYFEVLELMLEGFIHISELGEDYYVYDEKQFKMKGRHTGFVFASGDRMHVNLKKIDFILLQTEWHLREKPEQQKHGHGKPKKRDGERKRDSHRRKRKR